MSRVGCSFVLIVRQSEERYHTVNNRKRKSPLSADCGFETERKTLLQGGTYTVRRLPYRPVDDVTKNRKIRVSSVKARYI
jgi:hypothetical protein